MFELENFYKIYPQFLEKHAIDFYSIVFLKNGRGILYKSHKQYPVKPGSFLLISPYEEYLLEMKEMDGFILFFCQDFYTEEFNITRLLKVFASSLTIEREINSPVINPGKNLTEFDNIISFIFQEYSENCPVKSQSVIRSYLNILFLKLIDLKFEDADTNYEYNSDIILRFTALLENHFHQQHDIRFYSEKLNISAQRLNKILKLHLNISIKKLIQNKLMSESRKLLIASDLSSSEIAYKLNFHDNSYFNKVFHRYHKLTPGQFRNSHKKYHK